jgi:hypothetical protein
MTKPLTQYPGHACQVLPAEAIYVCAGVNLGDAIGSCDEVYLGDTYRLDPSHNPQQLVVSRPLQGDQQVAPHSEVGRVGDTVRFEARYSIMSSDGGKVELLLLCIDQREYFIVPLSPMAANEDYTLVGIEQKPPNTLLTDLLCVSFARGTLITLSSGEQREIEFLQEGDKVLTRDHGNQAVRWIGRSTLRAVGAFAPVVIPAGLLGNAGDLIVSQHHRIFLYQRDRQAGTPTSELLIQARYLVDNVSVFLREGGFVDYFCLVFDAHEIIYAEGVPAESLLVNDATKNMLPDALSGDVKVRFPNLSQDQHFGTEAGREFLETVGTQSLFKAGRRSRQ